VPSGMDNSLFRNLEPCYPVAVPVLKTCMVGFRTPAGEWVRVVSGESVFEAASHALAFFASDGWYDQGRFRKRS